MKLVLVALFLLFHISASFPQTGIQPDHAQSIPRARVIVFVHGLHGSRESWRASNGAYWPDLVRTDPHFAYSDVEVAEYPTPASNGKMSSVQLADILWTHLKQDHVWEHREVVFVAHSLGGILVEEMLLKHPAEAAKVKFIVSYGTPHEGSTIARIASIYDRDPLLNDLSDAGDNTFLTQLENNWRGHNSVNGIHRFCAFESEDTTLTNGFGRYLKTHARVVSYFSATYGCDVTTPPQEIHADHVHMIQPLDRTSSAYDFFYRVYRDNPILEEQVVTRDNVIAGLEASCDRSNENLDLQVPVALDSTMHEKVVAADASLFNAVDVRDVNPNPPVVTRIDPDGVAHVYYGFSGPAKKLFVCLGAAHASLKVQFSIDRQVPIREPQN
ncbi:esterase/lipase family protein [Acidicapsa acidisoli]|uniref:esterase/lipase family protein n=1 Tax=Acidicapsa acidisoli TaxID=1615681 RepID=UPI0021DFD1AB|nr:alpha/beta hydrolase [Acidicapsa acidisoli]